MKQLKHFLLTVLVALVCCLSANAHDFEAVNSDGVTIFYKIISFVEKTCAVTYCGEEVDSYRNEYTGSVNIPASVEYSEVRFSVTEIGECAFASCKQLSTVYIPNSVTVIGSHAFTGCSELTTINIPNSVCEFVGSAFRGCYSLPVENNLRYADNYMVEAVDKSLSSYIIREGTKWIGFCAFESCSNLTSVSIPNSVTSIENYAFDGCSSLTIISLPNGVTSLGNYAFRDCSSLASISLPASISEIGESAFVGCASLPVENYLRYADTYLVEAVDKTLSSYRIREGTKWIGSSAFNDCSGMSTVSIPNSVTNIGNSAFSGCIGLKSVQIPNKVIEIGNGAFWGCSGLSSVTIPNCVTSLKDHTFTYCSSLKSVTLPYGIISIGRYTFARCSALSTINLPNSITYIDDGAFMDCSSLISLSFPNSISTIGTETCSGCVGLKTISIPNSVSYIAKDAFNGCENMKEILCQSETPPSCGIYALKGIDRNNCKIYVPVGCESVYSAVAPWKEFKIIKSSIVGSPKVYNGNSDYFETINFEEALTAASAANALIFVYNDDENSDANIIKEGKATSISLTDAEPFYCPWDVEAEAVTYTRKFESEGWQALYVPFAMRYEEWSGKAEVAKIMGIHVYDDRTLMEFRRLKAGEAVLPNTPYVIKPLETGEVAFSCENRTLAATAEGSVWCATTEQKYTLTGVYQETPVRGKYVLIDGTFYQVTSDAQQHPFRFFLTVEDVDNGYGGSSAHRAPQRIQMMVDDEMATGIDRIGEAESGACFDLSGRKVARPQHGVYIMNGRKVVVR